MILLKNATIVTSEKVEKGAILIENDIIKEVIWSDREDYDFRIDKYSQNQGVKTQDLTGKHIIAGGVDAHVHFREPGLTHKADMKSEYKAAAAGGVTTVMDMPNTRPATTSIDRLAEKIGLAQTKGLTNIKFHIGATNENFEEISEFLQGKADSSINGSQIAGVKVFMGSSTGNMLVNDADSLSKFFAIKEKPVLVHCEDESTIRKNTEEAKNRFGEDIPFEEHENIRSRTACIKSSIKALELAIKHKTRLTLCHISTAEEVEMVRAAKISNPEIYAETSCNYLWFSNEDYKRLGSRLKCNPSIKTSNDRQALRNALKDGFIDTIGSDHAPHLLSEKENNYLNAPSGLPSIQQTLPVLITIAEQEDIPLERIASVFSEKAAEIYGLDTGKIAAGLKADLVIFDKEKTFTVKNEDQLSKCGWTPYEGETLKGVVEQVYINGRAQI